MEFRKIKLEVLALKRVHINIRKAKFFFIIMKVFVSLTNTTYKLSQVSLLKSQILRTRYFLSSIKIP